MQVIEGRGEARADGNIEGTGSAGNAIAVGSANELGDFASGQNEAGLAGCSGAQQGQTIFDGAEKW